jgi:uncharacterized membrane protein YdjX (TVP38/TMEM64 family)
VLVLLVAGFYAFGWHEYLSWDYVRGHLDQWKAQVEDNLAVAAVLFFLLYVAATGLSVPAAWILSLVAGALFGRWFATLITSVAATLGATLAFLSSRFLFREFVQRRFGSRLGALNQGVERDGPYYLFILRLIPVPFFLINLGMGLTVMRVWTYTWVSWVGMLPGSFLYVNAGEEIGKIRSPSDILTWQLWLSFALLGLFPLAARRVIHWWSRKRMTP